MLYLTYWEISEKINPAELVRVGKKLGELEGTEGAETLTWLVTPDYCRCSLDHTRPNFLPILKR